MSFGLPVRDQQKIMSASVTRAKAIEMAGFQLGRITREQVRGQSKKLMSGIKEIYPLAMQRETIG
jgi:very-short-patch-repair endonuclease